MNPLSTILLPAILGGGLLSEAVTSRPRSPSPPAMGSSTGSLHRAELSFSDFIKLLSLFHPACPLAERTAFCFRLFNLSDDGCLREGEVRTVLAAMVGDHLSEAELNGLVQSQFATLDQNRDGIVSQADFERMLSGALRKATINI